MCLFFLHVCGSLFFVLLFLSDFPFCSRFLFDTLRLEFLCLCLLFSCFSLPLSLAMSFLSLSISISISICSWRADRSSSVRQVASLSLYLSHRFCGGEIKTWTTRTHLCDLDVSGTTPPRKPYENLLQNALENPSKNPLRALHGPLAVHQV